MRIPLFAKRKAIPAAMAEAKTVIFENDDIVVEADLRATSGVVVGFSNYVETGDLVPFGDGTVQGMGFSGVFVTSKWNGWWQTDSMAQVCEAVRDNIAPFRERIGYGASMGAYGGLLMGTAMGLNRMVAVAPQTVIGDSTVPLNPRWVEAISQRPIIHDNVADRLGSLVPEILYDPAEPKDAQHVAHLRARHDIRELHFPFAGHKLLATLKECGLLKQTIAAVLKDGVDAPGLRSAFRANRHLSRSCLINAARYCSRRGFPDKIDKLAAQLQAADDRKALAVVARLRETAVKRRSARQPN